MSTETSATNEAEIIRSAYRAVRPLLMTEASFRASGCFVTRRIERFARARHVIERRTVERRSAPAPLSHDRPLEQRISPTVDAWTVVADELPNATRQLSACSACDGTVGRFDCVQCEGQGRVHTWLEVRRVQRVAVAASANALHWCESALDERDFERASFSHTLERDSTLTLTLSSRPALPALASELNTPLARDERVVELRVQRFVVQVSDVHYRTALGAGTVETAGNPLQTYRIVRTPLRRRATAAAVALLLGSLLSSIFVLVYRAQHPWFASYGESGRLLSAGLLGSALIAVALLGFLRARGARTLLSTWCPAAAAILLLVSASSLLGTQPSVAFARAALARHDLPRALLTAQALQALALPLDDRETLLEDIHLSRIEAAHDLNGKLGLASGRSWSGAGHAQLRADILGSVERDAALARKAGDEVALVRLAGAIAPMLPADSRGLAREAAAMRTRACLDRGDVPCVERCLQELARLRAGDLVAPTQKALAALLRERLERIQIALLRARNVQATWSQLTEAVALCDKLTALGTPPKPPLRLVLERALVRARAQLDAESAAEQQRIAQKREREAERAARVHENAQKRSAAEGARAAAERAL
jgi:hypothetical protein